MFTVEEIMGVVGAQTKVAKFFPPIVMKFGDIKKIAILMVPRNFVENFFIRSIVFLSLAKDILNCLGLN